MRNRTLSKVFKHQFDVISALMQHQMYLQSVLKWLFVQAMKDGSL